MTVSLPMCAIDFTNDAMGPEEAAIADRIAELKESMGDDLLILGHHYQRDQIVMHADLLGDSFLLSELAAKSSAKGMDIMLHLPMEPVEYPSVDPGPGALLTAMTPEEIVIRLEKNLDAVPFIKGVNNHTSSSF